MQDILDVLAAPAGAIHQFRYDEKYVDPIARTAATSGTDALVHFAIQQEAKYHEPAFIPVRRARVVSAELQAGIFVVEFEIGDYVTLKRDQADDLRSAVLKYGAALESAEVRRPYGPSLSAGADLRETSSTPFDETADAHTGFRSTVELLQRTEWFRDARFVRFLSLRDGDGEVSQKAGRFRLRAGQTYELSLTHYEPGGVTSRDQFDIAADDESLRVIGRPAFDVASRYDVVRVPIHAVARQRHESLDTVVTITPEPTVQGPTIRIPISITTGWRRTVGLITATAVVFIVFGLPAVFADWSWEVKFLLVILGAVGASVLQNVGWSASLPSPSSFSARPTGTERDASASGTTPA